MLVMTAKVDIKKIAIIGVAIVAVIIASIFLFSGKSVSSAGSNAVTSNDDRIQFLASYGWEVVSSPVETSQVRIPAENSDVFTRYNALQKSMGYDLSSYQGKTVMRYVYKIKNYPGATEPVYATLLISSNRIIGGDITDTCATGVIQGFEKNN